MAGARRAFCQTSRLCLPRASQNGSVERNLDVPTPSANCGSPVSHSFPSSILLIDIFRKLVVDVQFHLFDTDLFDVTLGMFGVAKADEVVADG